MTKFMKRLVIFLLIFFGGTLTCYSHQPLQIDFDIRSISEEDEDLSILQEFLFYHIHSQIAQDQEASFTISPDQGGKFHFEGTEYQFECFLERFSLKLGEGLSLEEFVNGMDSFLQNLEISGALFEKSIAEEIKWDHLPQAQEGMDRILFSLRNLSSYDVQVMRAADVRAPNIDTFYDLRLTESDQKNIEKLIKKLADTGLLSLLLNKREMEKLGDKVRPVHPLRFIGFILSRHDLKKRLPKIRDSHFKWKNFIGGFSERMDIESKKDNIYPHVAGFSHLTGISESRVRSYLDRSDWEGFVVSFMKK